MTSAESEAASLPPRVEELDDDDQPLGKNTEDVAQGTEHKNPAVESPRQLHPSETTTQKRSDNSAKAVRHAGLSAATFSLDTTTPVETTAKKKEVPEHENVFKMGIAGIIMALFISGVVYALSRLIPFDPEK